MKNLSVFIFHCCRLITIFTAAAVILFINGCSYDTLPYIPDYRLEQVLYDTSALIEVHPYGDAVAVRELKAAFVQNNYQLTREACVKATNSVSVYIVSIAGVTYKEYDCADGNYLATGVVVMVRKPGAVMNNPMRYVAPRYFQAFSQYAYGSIGRPNDEDRVNALRLALNNLFAVKEFRDALTPVDMSERMKTFATADPWQNSLFYQSGEFLDFHEALRWAFVADFQRNPEAGKYIVEYGFCGEIFQDKNYLLALAENHPVNMNKLGEMYEKGNGIVKNHEKAFRAYEYAARAGLSQGRFNLGRCYQYGIGVKKDLKMAKHWYRQAESRKNKIMKSSR